MMSEDGKETPFLQARRLLSVAPNLCKQDLIKNCSGLKAIYFYLDQNPSVVFVPVVVAGAFWALVSPFYLWKHRCSPLLYFASYSALLPL
jgi:hypothetical protein